MSVVLASIYGVVVMSLIIVSIQTTLDLTQDEDRAFLTLERLQLRSKIASVSQNIIQLVGRLYLNKFRDNQEKRETVQLLKRKKRVFGIFKRMHANTGTEGMKDAL